MSCQGTKLFINNAENRELMERIEFEKTPERISALLGALVKKGVIKREVNGVYSLPDSLFRTTLKQTENNS
jgi:histidinol-phosphate/aromatic aminotransferase/cobyric acid decarboxylase-like protein